MEVSSPKVQSFITVISKKKKEDRNTKSASTWQMKADKIDKKFTVEFALVILYSSKEEIRNFTCNTQNRRILLK